MARSADTLKGIAVFAVLPTGVGALLTGIGAIPGVLLIGAAAGLYWFGTQVEREAGGPPPAVRASAEPPPLPIRPLSPAPQAPPLPGPPFTAPEYDLLFFREARRFFRHPRNVDILGRHGAAFRAHLMQIYLEHCQAQTYIHPAQLLSQARGRLARAIGIL